MNRLKLAAFPLLVGSIFFSPTLRMHAQTILTLPEASQSAKVVQRVGVTDITITYHRPLVNGRKVWGGIVPYGQPWRAGANENTVIEFSDAVTIEGKALPKGAYGLHMIPGESEWTIAFSKSTTSWGSFSYDQSEDALRVTVKPHPAEFHEALMYEFDDVKKDSAAVTLLWEKLAVPFTVHVDLLETVQQSMKNQLRGSAQYVWGGWDEAASFLLTNKGNLDDALKYENNSIQAEERFENLLGKAHILESLGRNDEAKAPRDKALAMGTPVQLHTYGRQLMVAGKQDEAFGIFRVNMKKNPNDWTAHNEAARLACSKGDFDGAAKEMKTAASVAPQAFKGALDALAKRLEAKEDINR